jgi:hypothetical protein
MNEDVAAIIKSMRESPFADHAREIGNLCIAWSRLELEVTVFLYTLMQPVGNLEAIIPITNIDFREKLDAVLALGFHKKRSDDWFAKLRAAINEIGNDLRPQRNRFVHDHWLQAGGEVIKFTMKTSVHYEQARTLALKLYEAEPTHHADIFLVTVKVLVSAVRLQDLRAELPPLPDTPFPPSPEPNRDPG